MVSVADLSFEDKIPVGALWALCGSMLYALYLVSLRRRVDHEDKLDITMFFGKDFIIFLSYVCFYSVECDLLLVILY
jgi:drug/metabolite transporter (DMT)-like permease